MALFRKKEKSQAPVGGNPDRPQGKKSKLTVFLGILVILAGGGYLYMNYLGPKPAPRATKRVAKKRARPKAKKAVKTAAKKPAAKKEPAKVVPAQHDLASRVGLLEDRLIDKPTYEELLARVKRLEYMVQSKGAAEMRSARVAPTAMMGAVSTRKSPPREYRRLRAVFRAVESDRYPRALFDRVTETAPGSISFSLPELRDEGVEQVVVTSLKGKREIAVVTDEESKLTNRVSWSSGLWAYSRKDKSDQLNGVALPSVPVEDYLKVKEKYNRALDILYKALTG